MIKKLVERLLQYFGKKNVSGKNLHNLNIGKRKILFVLPGLLGGGAERVLLTASTQFPKDQYHKTLLILTDRGEIVKDTPEFDAVRRAGASRTIFSIWYLILYLLRSRPDVVFSTLLRTHVAIFIASRFAFFRPILVFRSPNMPLDYILDDEWRGINTRLINLSYRNADLVIAQTDDMRKQLITVHGIPDSRVKVALNPLDLGRVHRLAATKTNTFSPRYELEIVAVGRLTHQKGLDFLIRAFSIVVDRCENARLHILGADVEGRQYQLEDLASSLGIRDRVVFLGYLENPYSFIRDADVLAISSRYEGFPNTLLEAIALETPTVCTRCAGGLDAILDGKRNGILVDFGDYEAFATSLLLATTIKIFEPPRGNDLQLLITDAIWGSGNVSGKSENYA